MLYQNEGIYRYNYGVNWRALATLIIVVPVNLPGLIHAINAKVDIGNYSYFCKSYSLKECRCRFTDWPYLCLLFDDYISLTR